MDILRLQFGTHVFNSSFPGSLIQIWVPSNPKGAEKLPSGIVASESDFFPRRLTGKPSEVSIRIQILFLHVYFPTNNELTTTGDIYKRVIIEHSAPKFPTSE